MDVALLYHRLFDMYGEKQLIGGVETYLLKLADVIKELGWQPTLFQISNKVFNKSIENLNIRGLPIHGLKSGKQKRILYQEAKDFINKTNGLIIFGSDNFSVSSTYHKCISIQHGIGWDLPSKYLTDKKYLMYGYGAFLKKINRTNHAIKNFNNCNNRVCVDYNFLNWYRTFVGDTIKGRIWVIPNYCTPASGIERKRLIQDSRECIKIIFARRFTKYRGVELMAYVTKKILSKYSNIKFTYAGEGPEELWLKDQFKGEKRVQFIKYLPKEANEIHLDHDIAVVPSIASEGTSLSVAEAMGAGCAVVATAVGGITNMIIDGYNGLLVMPDKNLLLSGLELLINNSEKRNMIQKNAFQTAVSAFAYNIWSEKWKNVMLEVADS